MAWTIAQTVLAAPALNTTAQNKEVAISSMEATRVKHRGHRSI